MSHVFRGLPDSILAGIAHIPLPSRLLQPPDGHKR